MKPPEAPPSAPVKLTGREKGAVRCRIASKVQKRMPARRVVVVAAVKEGIVG